MGNDYKIIKKLGEGGFGEVYLIEKKNKKYALKRIKSKLKGEEKAQLKSKIDKLSKLNSEHIIKYYNYYEKNNTFNILMEFGGRFKLKTIYKK